VFECLGALDSQVVFGGKAKDGGGRHVEGEHLQDQVLHPKHLLFGVSVVRDVDKLSHIGRVDLLELTANKIANSINTYKLIAQ
jgi:hypothetical protein